MGGRVGASIVGMVSTDSGVTVTTVADDEAPCEELLLELLDPLAATALHSTRSPVVVLVCPVPQETHAKEPATLY